MDTKSFALIMGIVFLLIGVLGFVPGVTQPDPAGAPELVVTGPGHGYLLGLFHVNVLHNLVHLLFGVMGVIMARNYGNAVLYARIVAVAYGLLTIMGLIPVLNTTFGLIPIHGHDVWLHALIAAAAAYFGFMHRAPETATTSPTTSPTTTTTTTTAP